jgi:hypothetical protein
MSKGLALYIIPALAFLLSRLLGVCQAFPSVPPLAIDLGFAFIAHEAGRQGYAHYFRFGEFGWRFTPRQQWHFLSRRLPLFLLFVLGVMVVLYFLADSVFPGRRSLTCGLTLLGGLLATQLGRLWFTAYVVRRGKQLHTQEEAHCLALEAFSRPYPQKQAVPFGPVRIPLSLLNMMVLILGVQGSGKSNFLRLIQQATLPLVGTGQGFKAVCYDAKKNMVSVISGIGKALGIDLLSRIKILHPFDARSVQWNLGADCPDLKTSQTIAAILIPPDSGQNRHFTDAARDLAVAVLVGLIHDTRPDPGSLPDFTLFLFIAIATSDEDLISFLASHRHIPEIARAAAYLKGYPTNREAKSVFTSLLAYLSPFMSIAAAWDRAAEKISLTDWVNKGESILVLPADQEAKHPLECLNRIFVERAKQLLLSVPDVPDETVTTFLFFDEAVQLGPLDLRPLLTTGRSKGLSCIIAYQDQEDLRDAQSSKEKGNVITAMCKLHAIFKLISPATCQYAAELAGPVEIMETTAADSRAENTHAVSAGQFLEIPEPHPSTGLWGFYNLPFASFFGFIPGADLSRMLLPRDPECPDIHKRDPSDEWLRPLAMEERRRLHLPILAPPAAASPPSQTGNVLSAIPYPDADPVEPVHFRIDSGDDTDHQTEEE